MSDSVIGFLLLIVAAIALVRDALDWYDSGHARTLLGRPTLVQPVSRQISSRCRTGRPTIFPVAWDPVATTILAAAAFVLAGVLGVLFLLASRKRKKKRRRPRQRICAIVVMA